MPLASATASDQGRTESMKITCLLITSVLAFTVGITLQDYIRKFFIRQGWLARPSSRRRHKAPTPPSGGVAILATWIIGIASYAVFNPSWSHENLTSILFVCAAIASLGFVGFLDDIDAKQPHFKLVFQTILAVLFLFEPNIHALGVAWQSKIGFAVWPMMVIWMIGLSNAVNLIDGIDGLAGTNALLTSITALFFSIITESSFAMVTAALLIPGLLAFLKRNWEPAQVFMGDAGSLTIGFVLAYLSLLSAKPYGSYGAGFSLFFIFGLPILDMGLVTWRRLRNRLSPFRGDRSHLHHRLSRLGLSTQETVLFLAGITLWFQISAVVMRNLRGALFPMMMLLAVTATMGLLFMLRSVERWKILSLFRRAKRSGEVTTDAPENRSAYETEVVVDVGPLLETWELHEREKTQFISSLMMLVRSFVRAHDRVMLRHPHQIVFSVDADNAEQVKGRLPSKIDQFIGLYDLHLTLETIPIHIRPGQRKRLIRAA